MTINPADYKILIVDDVISNILLLKVLLTTEKYQIATANNGKQALEQVKAANPDLILLDVMMPDMTGFQVAETLRANPETADIPIIFLTALNSSTDIVKGFKVGANDFISKPFNKEELLIRVMHQITLLSAKRMVVEKTEELQRTIAGRDKLYSVIAHDLRSPIGSIKMVLNMLILSLPVEKIGQEMYDLLTMANQTTEDTFALLDNLLKWTKTKTGKMDAVYQDFDINELIDGVVEIFTMIAGVKHIQLTVTKCQSAVVYADADMIKTAIRNLLSNAIKFSNDNSEVIVKSEIKDNDVFISVQDFGCGISEEDQQKLLHTGTHYSTYGTHNEEGSGLGLLLTQDFVKRNGGELDYVSKKDEGSTFYFNIPLKK